jgi:hypothetical protein
MGYIGYMIIGIAVIGVLGLLLWILIRARTRDGEMLTRKADAPRAGPEENPLRGPVVGGVMRGDPGQVNPTPTSRGPQARDDEVSGEDMHKKRR